MQWRIENLRVTVAHHDNPVHNRYFDYNRDIDDKTTNKKTSVSMCFHPLNILLKKCQHLIVIMNATGNSNSQHKDKEDDWPAATILLQERHFIV